MWVLGPVTVVARPFLIVAQARVRRADSCTNRRSQAAAGWGGGVDRGVRRSEVLMAHAHLKASSAPGAVFLSGCSLSASWGSKDGLVSVTLEQNGATRSGHGTRSEQSSRKEQTGTEKPRRPRQPHTTGARARANHSVAPGKPQAHGHDRSRWRRRHTLR